MRTFVREDYFALLYDQIEKIKQQSKGGDIKLRVIGRKLEEKDGKQVAMLEVDISGFAVIRGWQLLASIHHTNRGNVIELFVDVPKEVYTQWYSLPSNCDHCGVNRRRNTTYIVRNIATDELLQIGESCLVKYNGGKRVDETVAIKKILGLVSSDKLEALYRRRPAPVYYVPDIIAGYILNSSVYQMGSFQRLIPEQLTFINDMEKWVDGLDDNVVAYHNMKVLLHKDFVRATLYDDVCNIVKSYKYALDAPRREAEAKRRMVEEEVQRQRRLEQERNQLMEQHQEFLNTTRGRLAVLEELIANGGLKARLSEFIGEVGDKVSVDICELRLSDVESSEYGGHYGTFTFIDINGNTILWITSVEKFSDKLREMGLLENVQPNKWFAIPLKLSGTVKRCFKKNGSQVTSLKNCRVKKGDLGCKIAPKGETLVAGGTILENLKLAQDILSKALTFEGYDSLLRIQSQQDRVGKCLYEVDSEVCTNVVGIRVDEDRYSRLGYILTDSGGNLYLIRVYNDLFRDLCLLPLGKLNTPLSGGYKLSGKVHTYLSRRDNGFEVRITELWYGKVEKVGV